MSSSRKRLGSDNTPDVQEMREQEVLRANKELAAYFRGRRTEREARAALKIIKAFIRDRERIDPASRRPFPAAASVKAASHQRTRTTPEPASHRRPRGARETPDKIATNASGDPAVQSKPASSLQE